MADKPKSKSVGITEGPMATVAPPRLKSFFDATGPTGGVMDMGRQIPRVNAGPDPIGEHAGPEGAGSYGTQMPSELNKLAPSENLPQPTKNNLKILDTLLSDSRPKPGTSGMNLG